MMKPSEILARSQEVLLERGLWQHASVSPFGEEVCSGGALYLGAGGVIIERYCYEVKENAVPLGRASFYLELVVGGAVAPWNDRSGRTLEEVLGAFHEAELLAKENGE